MGSPSSSRFSFLDTLEQPIDGPREWAPGLVLVPLEPADLPRARLLLQGTLLPLFVRMLEGAPRVAAQWPRCGTGNYRLLLEVEGDSDADTGQASLEQVVSIRPQKIGEVAYVALINDLQGDALPTSIALALERTGGLAGIHLEARSATTLEQELLRLRRAIVGPAPELGLAKALVGIARDPYRVLTKTEQWVRSERARRLEPVGLVRALCRPENLNPRTRRPHHVPDVRVQHTHDVYENRLIRLFVDQVDQRLRRLAAAFTESNLYAAVAEIEELQGQLATSLREAAFLEEVALPGYLPTKTTMVLLRRPLYRTVFERFLEFHREAYVELDEPLLDAPLDNLPHLYETWGVLNVIAAVLEIGEERGFVTRRQRIARHMNHSVFIRVLPDGEAALEMVHPDYGCAITLVPQRSFGRTARPYRSISFPQRPDITLEIAKPDMEPELLVFDPKYKLRSENLTGPVDEDDDSLEGSPGQPKKIDIDKMHAYRDAIRDFQLRPVVTHAAILYPGPSIIYDGGVAALSARPDRPDLLLGDLKRILRGALAVGP